MFKLLFKVPDVITLAQRDLESAKRELLTVQARAEYAAKMVEYYQELVKRLSKYVLNAKVTPE